MTLLSIIVFILILGVIVLVHEFGHFIWAKKFGVHIYEFSIGMGPALFTHEGKDKIKYRIRAFPIGGFVQMAGEVYEDDEKIDKKKFMCNKPWHQRIIIIIAGVVNNFILALLLLFLYAIIWGSPTDSTKITKIEKDYPMAEAGIVAGDKIIAINGKKVTSWDKAQILLLLKSKDNTYKIKIEHKDKSTDTYNIKPKKEYDKELKSDRYVFGFVIKQKINKGYKETKFCLEDLKVGAIDAMVMDGVFAYYYVTNSNEPFSVISTPLSTEEYSICFRKNEPELRDEVEKILKEMAADGTIAQISTKWFGQDVSLIGK